MEMRNIKKVSDSEYTMEINHPDFGWIPYTAVSKSGEKEMEVLFKKAKKECKAEDVEILQKRFVYLNKHAVKAKAASLKKGYSKEEIETWETKRKEAEKVLEGGSSEILEFEAKLEAEKPKALAEKIIKKSNAYHKELITASTLKKKLEKDAEKIKSIADYEKLNKQYIELLKVEDGETN